MRRCHPGIVRICRWSGKWRVDAGGVTLRARYGGEGEPVVLLHGHPRTHTTWHRVALRLSGSFFCGLP